MQKLVKNGKKSSRFTMPQRGGFRRQVRTATLKKPRNVYVYGSTPSPPRKRDRIGWPSIRQYENITGIGQLPYRVRQEKLAILGFHNQVLPFSIFNRMFESYWRYI